MRIDEETKQRHEQEIKRRRQYIEFPARWIGRAGNHMIRGNLTVRERGTVEIEHNGVRARCPYGFVHFSPIQILVLHDGDRWQALDHRPLPPGSARPAGLPAQRSSLYDHRPERMIYPYKQKWADKRGVPENATETDLRIDLLWKFTWEVFIRSTGSKP